MRKCSVLCFFLTFAFIQQAFGSSEDCSGRWLKTDLHSHSRYSDGLSVLSELISRAEGLEFDVFSVTDHDHLMGGQPLHWFDPSFFSRDMILLYGIEWTTPAGHANVWAANPVPYDRLWQANLALDAQMAVDEAHANGALFSINHPMDNREKVGWRLSWPEGIDSVEIWNGPFRFPIDNNSAVHDLWDKLLQSGRRIAGIGGSDTHLLHGPTVLAIDLGRPTTWVCAAERTALSVLQGISRGKMTLSYHPWASRIEFLADSDGDGSFDAGIGSEIPAGQVVHMRIESHEPHSASFQLGTSKRQEKQQVVLFRDGLVHRTWQVDGNQWSLDFTEETLSSPSYYRVEVTGHPVLMSRVVWPLIGNTLAITNPIYVR